MAMMQRIALDLSTHAVAIANKAYWPSQADALYPWIEVHVLSLLPISRAMTISNHAPACAESQLKTLGGEVDRLPARPDR